MTVRRSASSNKSMRLLSPNAHFEAGTYLALNKLNASAMQLRHASYDG